MPLSFFLQTDPRDPTDDHRWAEAVPGTMRFEFSGLAQPAGGSVLLQTSSDLAHWTSTPISLLSASFDQGIARYTFGGEADFDRRFYRLEIHYPND